jgi:predicted phage tail protein
MNEVLEFERVESSDQISAAATLGPVIASQQEVDDICFDVFAAPHPFTLQKLHLKLHEGLSLQEVLEAVQPDPLLRAYAHIFIEDTYIDRKYWHRVYPKKKVRVAVRCVPRGGGGGGSKGILRIVLFIAVIAAAFILPALLPVALTGTALIGAGAGALTVGALIQGGIMLLGGLFVNMIAPPPTQSDASKGGSTSTKPTMYLRGIQNSARPFGVLPRLFGHTLITPDFAALPYTEYVGKNQYLRMLFCLGYGPLHVPVTGMTFGNTSVTDYEEVTLDQRRGYQPNQIRNKGSWAGPGTPPNPVFGDRWQISSPFTFGSGKSVKPGDTITFASDLGYANFQDNWDINEDKPITLYSRTVIEQAFNLALTHPIGEIVRTTDLKADEISVDIIFPGGIFFLDSQSGNKYQVTVKFQIRWRPHGNGPWQVAPVGSNGVVTCQGANSRSMHFGYSWLTGFQGQYDVGIMRTTTDDTSDSFVSVSFWTALRTIVHESPINSFSGLCLVSMRVKATDQLNGVLNNFQADTWGIMRDYDPPTNTWITRKTQNPAAAFLEVLTGAGNAHPVPDSLVDFASIQDFYTFCTSKGYDFNLYLNYQSSVSAMLDAIGMVGRASKVLRGGRLWGVAVDKAQPAPVQRFTQRNSWNFSATRLYPIIPNALRCSYADETQGYATIERIVYDDGFSATNARVYEQVDMLGVTDRSQIWSLARFHIAQLRLRPEEFSFNADIEYIVCERGDWIIFTHDVISVGLGSGRISSITKNTAGQITQITTDEDLDMQFGSNYIMSIRTPTVTNIIAHLSAPQLAGPQNSFNVTPPIAAGDVAVDCLFSYGLATDSVMNLFVKSITPADNVSATLTCVDMAPGVWDADSGAIPPYDPHITVQPESTYPAITEIISDFSAFLFRPGGTYVARVQLNMAYANRRPDEVISIQARFRMAGSTENWVFIDGGAQDTTMYLQPVQVGSAYEVQMRFRLFGGVYGQWGPLVTSDVVNGDTGIPDPTGARVLGTMLYWDYPNPIPPGLAGYIVRYQIRDTTAAPNWDAALDAHLGICTSTPQGIGHLPAPVTILIKARDVLGNLSLGFTDVYWEGVGEDTKTVVHQTDYKASSWPGTKTNLTTDVSNNLVQVDLSMFWNNDKSHMWTVNTNLFWVTQSGDGSYLFSYTPGVTVGKSDELYLDWIILNSNGYKVEYMDANGAWQLWPVKIIGVTNTTYNFKLSLSGGPSLATVTYLVAQVKAAIVQESVSAFPVTSGGTRYPVTKLYRAISAVVLTAFNPPSGPTIVNVMDHNVSPGPLIRCYLATTGAAVASQVSGTIYGAGAPSLTASRDVFLEDIHTMNSGPPEGVSLENWSLLDDPRLMRNQPQPPLIEGETT